MARLDIDFHRPPRASAWGTALLAAGVICLPLIAGAHMGMSNEFDTLRLAQQESRTAEIKRLPQEPSQGMRAFDKAQLPWDDLFLTFESADNEDVAVLGIVPDSSRTQVRVHAEARHFAAMIAFHQRLQASPMIRRVILTDHDATKDAQGAGSAPVRFHVAVDWGKRDDPR